MVVVSDVSLTMPLLFGLIALFVEMLLDSSEAAAADDVDVVFKDVFRIDSLVFRDSLEASPLPVIVPFTGE